MKTLVNALLFVVMLLAWGTVCISGEMRSRAAGTSTHSIVYLAALFLALFYVQWYLRCFRFPLERLGKAARQRIVALAKQRYKTGFCAGTIGFGYFFALIYAWDMLSPMAGADMAHLALGGMFFIALGTIAQSRALVATLTDELISNRGQID
jgi:hypothetical protein